MSEEKSSYPGAHLLIILAALVIIIGGINKAQSVLMALLAAIFLAVIATPAVLWLKKKRIPDVISVLLVVTGMAAILVIIGLLVGTSLSGFSKDIPYYEARLQGYLTSLNAFLATKGIRIADSFIFDNVNPGAAMNLTANMIANVGGALCNVVVILLTVTFILLESSSFPAKLRAILGDPQKDFLPFKRFIYDIRRYMVIKTVISLSAGILITIWLTILGVDFPILWGFLTFLLHYVPNIGSLIAAVPTVLLALIQQGAGSAVLTASGYVVVNFTLGNVVEPQLMGQRLGLSTLAVFLSLMFWGSLLGLIGLVLSIPFTMALKFACEAHKSTAWIAILLSSERSYTNLERRKESVDLGNV